MWLADVNHLTKTETGIVFSSISLFAIIFQPVFGLMSDKLGLRKHLLWTITVLLTLFAPFFIFVFSAAADEYYRWFAGRRINLGIVFSSGSGAVEAYRTRQPGQPLEYGSAGRRLRRLGAMRLDNRRAVRHRSQYHLLIASGFALVSRSVALAVAAESSNSAQVIEALGANRQAFSLRTAAELLRMPRFWGFIVYVVGVASVYDVFDQQFANFFQKLFRQSAARYRSVWLRHHRRRVAQRADHVLRAGHR